MNHEDVRMLAVLLMAATGAAHERALADAFTLLWWFTAD